MTIAGSAIVDVLADEGVRRLYTVPGESFLEILDATERHPSMTLISTRHESGASFMAEADANLCGVPAAVAATRGVGAANLAIGVHTAYQNSTPMVILLGQVESPHLHKEAFQEVDLTAFYAPITKWTVTASRADRLPELVRRAARLAVSGRPGPVAVAVPADLLAEEIPTLSTGGWGHGLRQPKPTPSGEELGELAQRLASAERPIIIAGGGACGAREELVSFAEQCNAGVYAGFRRQDVFPNDHPLYLGHLGLGTPQETLQALRKADLVLVVGCRLSEITTQSYQLPTPETQVLQIDIEPRSIGAIVPVAQGVVADAQQALAALLKYGLTKARKDWSAAHESYLRSSTVPEGRSSESVDPSEVIAAMCEVLPPDTIITNDSGNFAGFLHRYYRFTHPGTQLAPTNGAMGYAIPAAVAAKLASPEREVAALVGDGGMLMTGVELETAVRAGARILVIAFRNGLYGTIVMHQAQTYGRTAGVDIGSVDLASYARSLGAEGLIVYSPDELRPALKTALRAEGPIVVDIVTDPELITPVSTISEMKAASRGGTEV